MLLRILWNIIIKFCICGLFSPYDEKVKTCKFKFISEFYINYLKIYET
jgi:hypothetical protein